MANDWGANIDTAVESEKGMSTSPGEAGTSEYPNGTYGMSDYTVRERSDGSGSDVYVRNDDSPKGYSHDFLDNDLNITKYHDHNKMLGKKLF